MMLASCLRRASASLTCVVVLAALILGVAPLASASAAAGPVITPTQAVAVVQAWVRGNNRVNATLDVVGQNLLERDSAAAIDNAYFRVSKKTGLHVGQPFTVSGLHVYLPRQTHYPALFVAVSHATLTGEKPSPATTLWLFQRNSGKDRWRLSSAVFVPQHSGVPKFTVDSQGYLAPLSATPLSQTRTALTALWLKAQASAAAGVLPKKPWTKTALLSGYVTKGDVSSGIRETDRFTRTPWAPVCVAAVGGALCFVSSNWRVVLAVTAAEVTAGRRIIINTKPLQNQYGGLAQGRYTSITVVNQREDALFVPAKHKVGGLRVAARSNAFGALSSKGTLG